jgi:hypothetical protein
MQKIKVRIPVYLKVSRDTEQGVASLLRYDGEDYRFEVGARSGSYLPKLRNDLVNDGASSKTRQQDESFDFDYFLGIDSDTIFDVEGVLKLLGHNRPEMKYPILSGAVPTQNGPELVAAGHWKRIVGDCDILPAGTKGFRKVDWVGAAFLLVHYSAFKKIPYPWFQGDTIRYREYSIQPSEDVGFCINAAKAGVGIYCDFDIKLGHVHRGSPF